MSKRRLREAAAGAFVQPMEIAEKRAQASISRESGEAIKRDLPRELAEFQAAHPAPSMPPISVASGHPTVGRVRTSGLRGTTYWNNIRRAWFVYGPDGPMLLNPQPPPPAGASLQAPEIGVSPAVKVML